MKADFNVWKVFLAFPNVYIQPFMDFTGARSVVDIDMFSDTSKNFNLGFGGYCQDQYFYGVWDDFVRRVNPSIAYLELYAVTCVVLLWIHKFSNTRVNLFVDNTSAMNMINSSSVDILQEYMGLFGSETRYTKFDCYLAEKFDVLAYKMKIHRSDQF